MADSIILKEDGSGGIALENGTGVLILEPAPYSALPFYEDWDRGNFDQWVNGACRSDQFPASFQIKSAMGCDDGSAFTCSFTNSIVTTAAISHYFGQIYTDIGFHFQHALWTDGTPVDYGFFSCLQQLACGAPNSSNRFQADFGVRPTGAVYLNIHDNTAPNFFTSAAGVIPFDGTYHGYQLLFSFPSHDTVVYNVLVDNVSVLSGSFTATTHLCPGPIVTPWGYFDAIGPCNDWHDQAGIGGFSISALRYTPALCTLPQALSAFSIIEVVASSAVVDFPACGAGVTGADCDCGPTTGTLIVRKVVTPSTPDTFNFNAAGGLSPSSFFLSDGDEQVFGGVAVGINYGISEITPPGYDTAYVVSNGSPHDNISVAAGETVTVLVTNTPAVVPPIPAVGCVVPLVPAV